jgi:nucleotide-binding universal stress UspA family protein
VAPAQLQRILVAINDTAADEQAVRVACTLGQQRKAQIFLIYVNVVSYQHPIDVELEADLEKGELALERATSVADSMHCRLETELLQGREAGPVIVAEASARRADLIVMSAGFNTVPVPPELTRTTKYVLTHSPIPVLLYAEPPVPRKASP